MSHLYYKYKIKYDSECGYDKTEVIYHHLNNTCNYQEFIDSDGKDIVLCGADGRINRIKDILCGDYSNIEEIKLINGTKFEEIVKNRRHLI